MLSTLTLLFVLAAADQTLDEVRPDVAQSIKKAEGMLGDFEEAKALAELDTLAARKDLTPSEVAHVQMWRGMALMALLRTPEANAAFGISRGCNPLVEPPRVMSPKVRQQFLAAAPEDCPVGGPPPDPTEGLGKVTMPPPGANSPPPAQPQPAPVTTETNTGGGGPGPMMFAGIGVAVVGVLVLAVAVIGGVLGAGLLVGSFPVLMNAQAQDHAADVVRLAQVALGMRLGGGGLLALGAVLGLVAVVVAVAGGALAAMNARSE